MKKERNARILVVDDQAEMAGVIAEQLCDVGYDVDTAEDGRQALETARTRLPDVVVTDLRMDGMDGFDVLEGMLKLDPLMPVLIMTAFGSIDTAVEAMKRGAHHYITKPFQLSQLLLFVDRAVAGRRLVEENRSLKKRVAEQFGLHTMVGRSRPMQTLFQRLERVSGTDVSVLIRGESGTGKELVAETVHLLSPRSSNPFVTVNCTAIPEQLLESELFGHIKGAFTGAAASRKGLFAEADGGTLFLDEIGDMPTPLQSKLLRVLEDSAVRAVGSDTIRKVDVRVIAATHQNLEAQIERGQFRADLYYRLNVLPVDIPPLRERIEDIPALITHFAERTGEEGSSPKFSARAVAALAAYPWPGNVRELKNAVQRLVLLREEDVIELEDVQNHFTDRQKGTSPLRFPTADLLSLKDIQESYISHVIAHCGGNKTQAAKILGIDVSTIHRRESKITE